MAAPGNSAASASSFEALEFREVGFSYGGTDSTEALRGLSFRVSDGELLTVVGPSGCGKSTMFNLAAGLSQPTAGTIEVNGSPLEGMNEHVAYMFQHDALLDWRTVLDNITIGQEFLGVSKKVARARTSALLAEFGLEGFEHCRPYELSGGMRQRAALLRTYATQRPLLLLDEPFGALDALTRLRMQEFLLSRWERDERTVIFITHDVDEALLLGDRVLVLGARPAQVREELEVKLPRPRELESVMSSDEFVRLRARIIHMLREEEAPLEIPV